VANVTKELYRLAMRDGYADLDFSAMYAFLNGTGHTDAEAKPSPAAATADTR